MRKEKKKNPPSEKKSEPAEARMAVEMRMEMGKMGGEGGRTKNGGGRKPQHPANPDAPTNVSVFVSVSVATHTHTHTHTRVCM